ncbi:basic helix-loop-helix protein [Lobosporangium transversale]|uniref:BHLH domain-containing protein n=1 Tax=Lobosporangium transversale TaxID=64571 RepID=A0A1Y2GEE1_9FUNG|nr:hypothetical protein BCR41DRAFT_399217 [Lobosporangium transversale]KAF9915561.1 basic helix-loop-helix protein [Lobosporangium transversale]ORZ08539.1 hypothetical protein BCR41DRAFT_399217 [Lobosporangium transversale]|eukprot:XP_021878467.1 hypothetical protein BCR41DRAFT_399217 [Lobosporangium transversale]
MTSSSDIPVQELLNNLTKTIKSEGIEKIDIEETLSAVIAQQTAAQVAQAQAQAQARAEEAQAQLQAQAQAQVSMETRVNQAQEEHNQQQINQKELDRIALEHQQAQQQLEKTSGQREDSQEALAQNKPDQPAISGESTATIIHVNALDGDNGSTLATVPITTSSPAPSVAKPAAGTPEWHKLRRDNHKEVERRRRETINAGINDLAACIPNPDKNKGAILRQAAKYIHSIQEIHQKLLAEKEALANIGFEYDRALLEKNMAQNELQRLITEHDQLKRDYEALKKEFETKENESKKRQRSE